MSVLLVVGLLFDLLLVGVIIVAGIAIALHFGGVGMRACPACGHSALMTVQAARTDGRLRMLQCIDCRASFSVTLAGSLRVAPTSQS